LLSPPSGFAGRRRDRRLAGRRQRLIDGPEAELLEGSAATVISTGAKAFTANRQQRATCTQEEQSERSECRQAWPCEQLFVVLGPASRAHRPQL
jgi:hypothetical protein